VIGIDPSSVTAVVTFGVATFAGIGRALNNFNDKVNKRFKAVEDEISDLETSVIRDYVLKQDFLREMQAVHHKLDRIWDYMVHHKNLEN
jgi:hypothetical protein